MWSSHLRGVLQYHLQFLILVISVNLTPVNVNSLDSKQKAFLPITAAVHCGIKMRI